MRILVAVCRVPDAGQALRIVDGVIDLAGTRMVMNPYDEAALEAALNLKDADAGAEVVAVTVGSAAAADVLRTALAAGAARAIHVVTDATLTPRLVAQALREVAASESADLILLGRQTTDWSSAQVAPMLAALFGTAQVTEAVSIHIRGRAIVAEHKVDTGIEAVEADLPCVVSADLRLGSLRFANLAAVLAARKRPIETRALPITAASEPSVRVEAARQQRRRQRVHSAAELVANLRGERLL